MLSSEPVKKPEYRLFASEKRPVIKLFSHLQSLKKICSHSNNFLIVQPDLQSFKKIQSLAANASLHQAYPLDTLIFLDYTPILAYLFR